MSVISSIILPDGPYTDLSYHASYILLQDKNGYTVYSVGENLSLQKYYSIQPAATLTADIAVVNVNRNISENNYSQGYTYFEEVSISSGTCQGLLITLTKIEDSSSSSACVSYPFEASSILDADLAIEYDQNSNSLRGIMFVSVSITYLGQKKPALYAFSIDYNLASQQFNVVTPKSYIDFGDQTFVKLSKDSNGKLFVFEV